MSVLTKLIITTCLSIMTGLSESKTSYDDSYYLAVTELSREDPVKEKAFEILTDKCNIRHSKRNRRWAFISNNMNGWSAEVYAQVFIKKRTSKDKKIKFTSEEYQDLLTWISSLKNNQNGNHL
ncbi:hypothetical protein [Flagellimonas sp. 2504JD1-5]|nr:hypothetical protein [uncultured Allomuricauda sp.]